MGVGAAAARSKSHGALVGANEASLDRAPWSQPSGMGCLLYPHPVAAAGSREAGTTLNPSPDTRWGRAGRRASAH